MSVHYYNTLRCFTMTTFQESSSQWQVYLLSSFRKPFDLLRDAEQCLFHLTKISLQILLLNKIIEPWLRCCRGNSEGALYSTNCSLKLDWVGFLSFSLRVFAHKPTVKMPTGLTLGNKLYTAFISSSLMNTSNIFSASHSTDISTTFSFDAERQLSTLRRIFTL